VQAAIGDGARVHPGAEHGADCAPQLLVRLLRERLAALLLHPLFVAVHEVDPVIGVEVGVESIAVTVLVLVENLLEMMMFEPEHHVGVHRYKAAIGIVGKTPIAGFARQRLHRLIVEAEIEHGVHHARHGRARARAHRDQKRIVGVAEAPAGDAAYFRERHLDLARQAVRIGLGVLVVIGADRGGDGEAGRHRQAEIGHLGQARALAAEEVAHVGAALGFAVAETIDPLGLAGRGGGLARRALFRTGFAARRRGLTYRRSADGFLLWAGTARYRLGHAITNSNVQDLSRSGEAALSAEEVIDTVEPGEAYDDEINRNDEIQQPRHDQYQYAGNERNERRDVGNCQRHGDLLGLGLINL
jgi:hypothetical protein